MSGTADPDELSWVVYTSVATARFDDRRLRTLLETSRAANAERGVTGLLLYRDQRFLQALEGPAEVVDRLVSVIAADPRHRDVEVVVAEPVSERRFPAWAMGYTSWWTREGRLPSSFVEVFDALGREAGSDESVRTVRGLLDWFRHRDTDPHGDVA